MKVKNHAFRSLTPLLPIVELTKDSKNVTLFGTIDSVTALKAVDGTVTELTLCFSDQPGSVSVQLRIGEKNVTRWQSSFQVGDLLRVTGDGFAENESGELRFCAKETSVFPIEDAKTLWELVWNRAKIRWGEPLPAPVAERLEKEQAWIEKSGYTELLFQLYRMTALAREEGYPITVRNVGASLVAFLAGLTEIDPLPPHYVCPICRHSAWYDDGTAYIGFDLPEKTCPACGTPMLRDGYRIPAESFFRRIGPKKHRFVVNAAQEIQPKLCEFLDSAPNIPETAVRIFDELEKLSILRKLERTTGVPVRDIPPDDKALLHQPLPLFDSDFLRMMFAVAQPRNLSDLIRLFGLAFGQNTWMDNANELLKTHACSLADVVAVKEDIFYALSDRGVETETAVDIMKAVSRGRGLTEEQAAIIRSAGLPDQYVDVCRKIRYLSGKSLAVAYALTDLRLAWYPIHYPTEYDAVCSNKQKSC